MGTKSISLWRNEKKKKKYKKKQKKKKKKKKKNKQKEKSHKKNHYHRVSTQYSSLTSPLDITEFFFRTKAEFIL